jgi:hypothetical protein
MKNLFISAATIMLTFISCKKAPAPQYSALQATVEGKKNTFDAGFYTFFKLTPDSVSVVGNNDLFAPYDGLSVSLNSDSALAPGTYTISSQNKKPAVFIAISYLINSTNVNALYQVDTTGSHPASVTINTISAAEVHGTFSGELVRVGNASPGTYNVISITNGKFDNPEVPLVP